MANPEKSAAVAEIAENLRNSNAAMLTEYRGLTVTQLKQLRRSLGDNANYAVVKNTLTQIAAKEVGIEGLDADLNGPTAIAYVTGEPVEVAKALRDFAKAHPALVIKSGVLDGKPLTAAEVNKLADLESREVLLAKAAGAMKAKISQAAYVFVALPSQMVRLIDALQQKVAEQGPVVDASAPQEAPAAETVASTEATDTAEAVTESGETPEAPATEAVNAAAAPSAEASSTEAAPAKAVTETETTESN